MSAPVRAPTPNGIWPRRAISFAMGGTFCAADRRERGGNFFTDADGRRILDFTSASMSAILGHSHPQIVEVARRYMGELDHLFRRSYRVP